MMSQKPRTRVLAYFVAYYRLIGIHVIEYKGITNYINFAFSLCLNAIYLYSLFFLDPLRLNDMIGDFAIRGKPLFAKFLLICPRFFYSWLLISLTIDSMFNGHKVIRLLDSNCFRRHYQSKRKAMIIFAIVIGIGHISFVFALIERVQIFKQTLSNRMDRLENYMRYICIYFIFNQQLFIPLIAHYYNWATYCALEIEFKRIQNEIVLSEEDRMIARIRELALVNRKVNHLMGWPIFQVCTNLKYKTNFN